MKIEKNIESFIFTTQYEDMQSNQRCDICGLFKVTRNYVRLVTKLRKFLPDDYPYICCLCRSNLKRKRYQEIITVQKMNDTKSILSDLLPSQKTHTLQRLARKYANSQT